MARTAEPQGKFAQAGSVKIHYHDLGEGYPLICLHGAGPGASAWSNFRGNFGDFAKHYRTILMDMPQYGRSDKPAIEGGRLQFNAGALREFMDALGIEKAHFLGNSMGGQVALKLAIDAPEKVNKVAVIGSGAIKSGSIFQPMPLEGIRNIGAYYKGEGPTLAKMRQLLESLVCNRSFVTDDLVRERYDASSDPELVELFGKHAAPVAEDLYADIGKVAAKTLIIWGQDDRAGALDVGLLMLRRMQDARLYVFSHCGHWAQVEHRDEFNRVVLEFFRDGRD